MKSLMIALGVVCSLTGAASGEVFAAQTRTVRGPSQRATRLPVRDTDHPEWDSTRMDWLLVAPSTGEPLAIEGSEPPTLPAPIAHGFLAPGFDPPAGHAAAPAVKSTRAPPFTY